MSIITFIVVVVVVGLILYVVNAYVPLQPPIRTILNVGVAVLLLLWLLSHLGVFGPVWGPP